MIPLGTDRPLHRRPVVTPALIAINVGVFFAMAVMGLRDPDAVERLRQAGQVGRFDADWYRFITSAFLHAGFMHIAGNMLFLWVFGPPVEDRLGRWWFLAFYLGAAVVSALVHIAADRAPAIGASGAIAGVAGAFLVLFPLTRIRTLMIFIIIGLVMVPSWFFVGLKIAFDLFAEGFSEDNVANMAHLGGYAYGIVVALVLLWTKLLRSEPYDVMTMLRQRRRRQQIRAAVSASAQAGPRQTVKAAKPDPESDELAERRAKVSSLVAGDELEQAADEYQSLVSAFAHRPHAGTLSRDAQLKLVGYLLGEDRRPLAARALEGFMGTYPSDPERRSLGVLLARLYAHDLGNPQRARDLLTPIAAQDADTDSRDIAREELASLPPEETP
jgi:membrane associated rhomboid family serine protease